MIESQSSAASSITRRTSALAGLSGALSAFDASGGGLFDALLSSTAYEPLALPQNAEDQPQATDATSLEVAATTVDDSGQARGEDEDDETSEATGDELLELVNPGIQIATPVAPVVAERKVEAVGEDAVVAADAQSQVETTQSTTDLNASQSTDAAPEVQTQTVEGKNPEIATDTSEDTVEVALADQVGRRSSRRDDDKQPTVEVEAVTTTVAPVETSEPTEEVAKQEEVGVPTTTDSSSEADADERGQRRERKRDTKGKELRAESPVAPAPVNQPESVTDRPIDAGKSSTSEATKPSFTLPETGNTESLLKAAEAVTVSNNAATQTSVATVAASALAGSSGTSSSASSTSGRGENKAAEGTRTIDPAGLSRTATTPSARASEKVEEPQNQVDQYVQRAQLVQRVTRAFQRLGEDGGTVRVRLNPPSLGVVRVEVQIEGSNMRARMVTENETARTVLKDQLGDLRQRLADQGIQVDRIDVETEAFSQEFQQNSARDGQSGFYQDYERPSSSSRVGLERRSQRDVGDAAPRRPVRLSALDVQV